MTKYRDISEDKILEFPATPGFKGWKPFFTPESTTHPAKMNLNLLRWILEAYTSEGDVVLDPMAGTGSTVILAALMGRHGVAVEYEPRFCDMIRKNIGLTERQATLTPKGRMACIQGDARKLSKLLKGSDAIITSPPYGEAQSGGGIAVKGYDGPKHSPTDLVGKRSYMPDKFEKEDNIGVLEYGDVDAVITSPPYGKTQAFQDLDFMKRTAKDQSDKVRKGEIKGHYMTEEARIKVFDKMKRSKIEDPDNISNLEYGEVDTVITSPPYEGSVPAYDEKWLEEHWDDESDSPKHKTMRFGRSMRGYPKKVDSVVTSPPYGNRLADDVVHDGDEARMSYRQAIDSIVTSPPYESTIMAESEESIINRNLARGRKIEDVKKWSHLQPYSQESEDTDNIGTLKGETYLEAMLKVYRECHKVLKLAGRLIVVVKNFIRDKQVVRLDEDTIKLCEASGFRLADRWYFRLPTRSFWRILYRRKYPDVPEVEYEDVLVFEK